MTKPTDEELDALLLWCHSDHQREYTKARKCGLVINALRSALAESEAKLAAAQYPDTEADGVVFCGKCGSRK